MSSTPSRYRFAGDSTANVYLKPWLKIFSAAPLPSTIGIFLRSTICATVNAVPEPYGPRMKLT